MFCMQRQLNCLHLVFYQEILKMGFHAHKTGNKIGLNDPQKIPSPSTKYLKTKLKIGCIHVSQ